MAPIKEAFWPPEKIRPGAAVHEFETGRVLVQDEMKALVCAHSVHPA